MVQLTQNFKTATINHSVTPPDFKFYFKLTSSGNLADLLLASLPDFDPAWIILSRQGKTSRMPRGDIMKEILYNKTRSERRF